MDQAQLDRLLSTETITLEEPPAEKNACIEFLLDLAVEAGRVSDREATYEALMEREAETSTGVGKGIGIPHAKSAGVDEPTLLFTRSNEGVDFDSMDDQPATLIFMILVPAEGGEEHLQILSSLSRALMHEENRDRLHEADSAEAVRDVLQEVVS